jgi:hypothetical protein
MVVGASIGEMLIPLTVANVSFKWYSPVTFLYILLACSIGGLFIYAALLAIGRPLAQAKQAGGSHSRTVVVHEEDEELLPSGIKATSPFDDADKSQPSAAYGTFKR